MTEDAIADLWVRFMTDVLGYKTFAASGGDYGTLITKSIALSHADSVIAIHLIAVGYPDSNSDLYLISCGKGICKFYSKLVDGRRCL
jgi:pimeloyl-ACP methyl ester carboxylesterase